MAVKDLLSRKRDELQEWRQSIVVTGVICSFVLIPLLLITPLLMFRPWIERYCGPMDGWFATGASLLGQSLETVLIIILALTTLIVPIWLVPRLINNTWKRQYERIFKLLHQSNLPVLIIDDTFLSPLWAALERQPLLRLLASQRPQSIDQRIEFTSDYWRAVLAVLDGKHAYLKRAIFWGNATRLVDDTAPIVYNSCVSLILIVFLAPFVILVAPFWIGGLALCIQQQACQAAMVDYFLENPSQPLIEDDEN